MFRSSKPAAGGVLRQEREPREERDAQPAGHPARQLAARGIDEPQEDEDQDPVQDEGVLRPVADKSCRIETRNGKKSCRLSIMPWMITKAPWMSLPRKGVRTVRSRSACSSRSRPASPRP
jgi:hypothetical protein